VYGGLRVAAPEWTHGCQDIHVAVPAGQQNLFAAPSTAMSRRRFQRRRFDAWLCEQLVDEMLARYLDWRAEAEAVDAAYGVWSRAPQAEGALAFAAYGAAVDREERAATVYRSVIDRIEQLFGGEERLAGARPGAARA
jgi:hypothetical protein